MLTAGEREAITSAEHREVRLKPGEILMAEGGLSDTLFVVHYGWLHSSAKLSTGGRQILRFHRIHPSSLPQIARATIR